MDDDYLWKLCDGICAVAFVAVVGWLACGG